MTSARPPAGSRRPRVVVVQSQLADYRQAFLDDLAKVDDLDLRFLVGRDFFDGTTFTRVSSPLVTVADRNVFLLRRKLLWQRGVVRRAVGADVSIVEYNPRIISGWLILLGRRVLRRPTAVWGHAWSRSGRDSRSEPARRWQRRLAGSLLLYTYGQATEMNEADPRTRTFVMPNALYSGSEMVPVTGRSRDVVYCGRLVASKKPSLLVEGFAKYAESEPDGELVVIGEGPETAALVALADRLGISERVRFTGHVAGASAVRPYYEDALCAVSPGYVGLSATQSLGFGVPLVYADDEPHAPEVELLDPTNSVSFVADDPEALAKALRVVREDAARWSGNHADISAETARLYSSEAMAAGLTSAIRTLLAERGGS